MPWGLAAIWVATVGTAFRIDDCLGLGGAGDRELPCHSGSIDKSIVVLPQVRVALWSVREALCESSHESAQNLFPPSQPLGESTEKNRLHLLSLDFRFPGHFFILDVPFLPSVLFHSHHLGAREAIRQGFLEEVAAVIWL